MIPADASLAVSPLTSPDRIGWAANNGLQPTATDATMSRRG
jgi:hypothetical protein